MCLCVWVDGCGCVSIQMLRTDYDLGMENCEGVKSFGGGVEMEHHNKAVCVTKEVGRVSVEPA